MRRISFILVPLVVACGGGGGNGTVAPPVERGQVSGMVLDEDGAGLASVPIELRRTGFPTRTSSTAANGSYSFSGVEVGSWNVVAQTIDGFEADGPLTVSVLVTANATANANPLRLRRTDGDGPAVINIADNSFLPATINVAVGRVVRWVNGGAAAHNTTSSTGLWSSGDLPPGQVFERTFNQAGTFSYNCTLHPGMSGSITVQ